MKQNQQTQPATRETLRESEESGSKYGPKHSQILEDRGTSYHNNAEETLPRRRSRLSFPARPSDSLGQSARRHLWQTSSVCTVSRCRSETAEAARLSRTGKKNKKKTPKKTKHQNTALCSPETTSPYILFVFHGSA